MEKKIKLNTTGTLWKVKLANGNERIYSYNALIGVYDDEANILYLSEEKHSHTTSCHESKLRREYRWTVLTSDEFYNTSIKDAYSATEFVYNINEKGVK